MDYEEEKNSRFRERDSSFVISRVINLHVAALQFGRGMQIENTLYLDTLVYRTNATLKWNWIREVVTLRSRKMQILDFN